MIGLVTFLVRLVLLAAFVFGFVVLFEHGPRDFAAGAAVEARHFEHFLKGLMDRTDAAPAPEPSPAPVATPVAAPPPPAPPAVSAPANPSSDQPPSAWEQLQSRPIGEGMNQPVATPIPDASD